jgi:chaperone required for assembly of F1-ATPase
MALHNATALCGSVIVGLALLAGRIGPDEAFEISQLDETFQIERWGEDVELAARRAAVRKEIEATAEFTRLLDAA